MKKKYYVYMHLYNNHPVYCGVGSVEYSEYIHLGGYDKRAYMMANRNIKYLNFIKAVGKENIEVRIVARFDDKQDALWLEDELHEVYDNLYSICRKNNKERYKRTPIVVISKDNRLYFNSYSEGNKVLNYYTGRIRNNKIPYSPKHKVFILSQDEYNNETYDELIYKYGIVQLEEYLEMECGNLVA